VARFRLAVEQDIPTLIAMRREFTFENTTGGDEAESPTYLDDAQKFMRDAIEAGRWHVWVAEVDGQIVSHAFVAYVDKVPRPTRERRRIAYLTNVYTRPDFRGRGIGGALIERAQARAAEADVELMMVWPSDESIDFYRRQGFAPSEEPVIWVVPEPPHA